MVVDDIINDTCETFDIDNTTDDVYPLSNNNMDEIDVSEWNNINTYNILFYSTTAVL